VNDEYGVYGKKLLVVGGTSGMGLATAKRVVENGGSVVLVGNRRQKAEQARQALAAAGKVDVIVADLMSESGMQQVMALLTRNIRISACWSTPPASSSRSRLSNMKWLTTIGICISTARRFLSPARWCAICWLMASKVRL
jgi:NAD(P)-dependent dehydrogenase (short-subunit alcohol dehydrogenase family)